ncbi:MAG: hypothetical protein LQ340_006292, partial [Diploschistes diacapsis]
DHFDEKVESSLRRDLPIITTPHAKSHLSNKGSGESFTAVTALDFWESATVRIEGEQRQGTTAGIQVTGMPGKHVPPGVLATLNDLVQAVPPTNGWMIELGAEGQDESSFQCGYRARDSRESRIYISGDTLMIDDLKDIPTYLEKQGKGGVDLMLIHLGGTTLPSPSAPLLMVTMDAKQGLELVRLIQPDVTVPIHYDDYDVFLSPLDDFKKAIKEAGLEEKVVYLDRGDQYKFKVRS